VAQASLDWFFRMTVRQTTQRIGDAASPQAGTAAVEYLQDVATQPRWFETPQVEQARALLAEIEAPGERLLAEADTHIASGRSTQAAELLKSLEARYGRTRLGQKAADRRQRLQAASANLDKQAPVDAARRAEQAMTLYAHAQKLVAQQRLGDATTTCRQIIAEYGDTPAAERARTLLKMVEARNAP
jgi:outer membrane protein assembly factor BamD (BamD/ComL family)